jgi:hypothetical protein
MSISFSLLLSKSNYLKKGFQGLGRERLDFIGEILSACVEGTPWQKKPTLRQTF